MFPTYVVDAFTDQPFSGNPAAVCLVGHEEVDVALYQQIASEMNLSETAFVRKKGESQDYQGDNCFELRWFTPKCEVPLCGHATLASAAVLFSVVGNSCGSITFETKSGPLNVKKDGNLFCLDMPLNKPVPVEKKQIMELQQLIEATVGQLTVTDVRYSCTTKKLLLRLEDTVPRSNFEEFVPNFQRMLDSGQGDLEVRGVIVTVKGSQEFGYCNNKQTAYDFVSRYFAPWVGINEDPVTGSAHTVLASYWSEVLQKYNMLARQCSSRGGDLRISFLDGNRVEVAGPAVIVLRGELR